MKFITLKGTFAVFELVLLFAVILAMFLPLAPLPFSLPSRDSGVFLYTGWRVLNGDVPYLDVWDHKPPVIYYLDAFGLWLTPGSPWGVWVVEVLLMVLSAIIGYGLLKNLFSFYTAVFSTFLWLFSGFYLLAGGNLTTEYALPSQFILLWLFYRGSQKPAFRWTGLWIGIVSGILFFTRQNAIAIPVAICVYLIISRIVSRKLKGLLTDMLYMGAGFVIVAVVFVGYFAIQGALRQFWDVAFVYNFAYAGEKDLLDRINALIQGINQLQNVGLAQLAFCGWGTALLVLIYQKKLVNAEVQPFLYMAVIAFPLELFFVSLGGRPRIPYFLVVLPVFSIFAGFTVWMIFSYIKTISHYAPAIFTFWMVFALGIVFLADYSEMVQDFLKPVGDYKIVDFIENNTSADDYVLMWGAEASYNFASMRPSPTRYVYQTPLYNIKDKGAVFEFLNAILEKKPQLIILKSDEKLSERRFAYRDTEIEDLMGKIKAMYAEKTSPDGWLVYQYVQSK